MLRFNFEKCLDILCGLCLAAIAITSTISIVAGLTVATLKMSGIVA
jgi:hypothetical protein